MKLVIVESPAKAKTINGYLGKGFRVMASVGHVRDLPSKEGSVDPKKDFSMTWVTSSRSKKVLEEIVKASKEADELYLATDPDREGEAISWHVYDYLRSKKVLPKGGVRRIAFNEITKEAVREALAHPRTIDQDLVDAYLARRALDYLMGFTLSPVLWRKLPGSRSAGRVQSVALKLITEREEEIEQFIPQEFWSILGSFLSPEIVQAKLTHLKSKKLEKFSLSSQSEAEAAVDDIQAAQGFHVTTVEKKEVQRHPSPPFTTSTLQQEAARKLGFSASRTMRVAQSLYEGVNLGSETKGLITYMRTDSVSLSKEALSNIRRYIESHFKSTYLPQSPRNYKTKVRNAQEAHEAIRPTDSSLEPSHLKNALTPDQFKLYDLIWKRAVASQMTSPLFEQMGVDIFDRTKTIGFRATGSRLLFDGFLTLYEEGKDDAASEEDSILPPLSVGQSLTLTQVTPSQHFTSPPPRFSEASLVKRLEELGIGRPSTYASILQVLQDRGYVRLETRRFFPEERGRIVTAFLDKYFTQYLKYDFTAQLEEDLDQISEGKMPWRGLLKTFWEGLEGNTQAVTDLKVADVISVMEEELASMLFPPTENGKDPRICPNCLSGKLNLKLGKYGAFLGCSNYPTCPYTRPVGGEEKEENMDPASTDQTSDLPRLLGTDPKSNEEIWIKKGPYGLYLQLGEGTKTKKPKRIGLPKTVVPSSFSLEQALPLLALPRDLGSHPDSQLEISTGIGAYGPYIRLGKTYHSIKPPLDPYTLTLKEALTFLSTVPEKKASFRRRASS